MATNLFKIYSPVLGLKKNQPGMLISEAFSVDNLDVLMIDGEVQKVPAPATFLTAAIPDGEKVLKLTWFRMDEGTGHLLAFTTNHVYKYDPVANLWRTLFICGAACEGWSVTAFNNKLIATNNLDLVQTWDGVKTDFEPLGTGQGIELLENTFLTAAKIVVAFENYLIFMNTVKGGLRNPYDFTWSDIADETNFTKNDSGEATIPGQDRVTAAAVADDQLYIFCDHSLYRVWATGTSVVFNLASVSERIGGKAPESIARGYGGETLFLASDKKLRLLQSAGELTSVGEAVDPILRKIPDSGQTEVVSGFITRFGAVLWSIPQTDGSKVILCLKEGVWTMITGDFTATSEYEPQHGYTIDNVAGYSSGIPFSTFDSWGSFTSWGVSYTWDRIDYEIPAPAIRPVLAVTAAGQVQSILPTASTAGGPDGYIVLMTDLAQGGAVSRYKRILRLRLIFRGETAGTMAVSVAIDGASGFTALGTVDTVGTADEVVSAELPVDIRGKLFKFKIAGAGAFRLIGMEIEWLDAGER